MMVINLGLRLWYSKMNIYAALTPPDTQIHSAVRYTRTQRNRHM